MFIYKKRLFIGLLATVGMFSFAEAAVPEAPGPYVGVTMIDNSSVRVNAADNSNNEDGFYVSIYKYPSLTLFDTIEVDGSDSSQMEADVTGLTCNQTYKAVVVAYNDEGNSSVSDNRYFNMGSTFGVSCPNGVPNAPGPYIGVSPIFISPTEKSKTSVRVDFLDHSDNETGFRIFGNGINETVSANDETAHPYVYKTIDGLTCDTLYQIKAVAFNDEGDSTPSDSKYFKINSTFSIPCDGENQAPIANAGADQTVAESATVQLDGSVSVDPDGDVITYTWSFVTKPAGSTATLSDATAINPTFESDVLGNYLVQLVVNDGQVDSVADTVTITVTDDDGDSPVPPAIDPTGLVPEFD